MVVYICVVEITKNAKNMNMRASPTVKDETQFHHITGRFGKTLNTRPCDKLLLETENYYVTPCLGSIVPNWVLIWPRSNFLNCRQWLGSTDSIAALSNEVLSKLTGKSQTSHVWFEHGCEIAGSATGCGVNFAHLHLLIEPDFDFQHFSQAVTEMSEARWRLSGIPKVKNETQQFDYHIFGQSNEYFLLEKSNNLGSQFFRRVIANLANDKDVWDYKLHPFKNNAAITVEKFSS